MGKVPLALYGGNPVAMSMRLARRLARTRLPCPQPFDELVADPASGQRCAVGVRGFGEVAGKINVAEGAPEQIGERVETRATGGPCGDGARMVSVEGPIADEGLDAGKKLFERFLEPGLGLVQRARSR